MTLRSRVMLFALLAAPGAALPNDIRCTGIGPGQDPRPPALAAETSLPAPLQLAFLPGMSVDPNRVLVTRTVDLRELKELMSKGTSFGAPGAASMGAAGMRSTGGPAGGMGPMSAPGSRGIGAAPHPGGGAGGMHAFALPGPRVGLVDGGVSPAFREHALDGLRFRPPGVTAIPMATDSVDVAVELDRIAKTPAMCRLQGGYGMARPECAALLGGQAAAAQGGAWVASSAKRCTPEITAAWTSSVDGAKRYIPFGSTLTALAAAYLRAPEAFKASAQAKAALKQFVDDTGQLLDNCFIPAEDADYEKSHHVLRQMGKLIRDGEAVCTGLMLRNDYFITARHCFEAMKNGPDVWFQPYQSPDRYQVCAIAERDALGGDKFKDIDTDQVLVRIARTPLQTAAVEIAAPASLMTVDDGSKGKSNAPTLLANFSYFPLADQIRKERFKSGFVKDAAKYCAIAAMDNGCFAHVCGAVPGGSGSPVFVHDAAAITLAGTHVGASNDRDGLACKSELGTQTNSAVIANALYAPALFKQ